MATRHHWNSGWRMAAAAAESEARGGPELESRHPLPLSSQMPTVAAAPAATRRKPSLLHRCHIRTVRGSN